jgi:hypothetical protein
MYKSLLYFKGSFLFCSNSKILSLVISFPAAFLKALVHLVFLGLCWALKCLWHFDRQKRNIYGFNVVIPCYHFLQKRFHGLDKLALNRNNIFRFSYNLYFNLWKIGNWLDKNAKIRHNLWLPIYSNAFPVFENCLEIKS